MKYDPMATYVVSVGTYASFGDKAAAALNNCTCFSGITVLSGKTVNSVVNLSSCTVYLSILVQGLLVLILTGLPPLDNSNRPTRYLGTVVHAVCPRKGTSGVAIVEFGCYAASECKSKGCGNICETVNWNNGQNIYTSVS